jgi:hypothetical protein
MEIHEGIVGKESSLEYDVVAVILTLSISFAAHLKRTGAREGMRKTVKRDDQLISHESEEKGIAL